jgi:lysophospholipase L1-like esterase
MLSIPLGILTATLVLFLRYKGVGAMTRRSRSVVGVAAALAFLAALFDVVRALVELFREGGPTTAGLREVASTLPPLLLAAYLARSTRRGEAAAPPSGLDLVLALAFLALPQPIVGLLRRTGDPVVAGLLLVLVGALLVHEQERLGRIDSAGRAFAARVVSGLTGGVAVVWATSSLVEISLRDLAPAITGAAALIVGGTLLRCVSEADASARALFARRVRGFAAPLGTLAVCLLATRVIASGVVSNVVGVLTAIAVWQARVAPEKPNPTARAAHQALAIVTTTLALLDAVGIIVSMTQLRVFMSATILAIVPVLARLALGLWFLWRLHEEEVLSVERGEKSLLGDALALSVLLFALIALLRQIAPASALDAASLYVALAILVARVPVARLAGGARAAYAQLAVSGFGGVAAFWAGTRFVELATRSEPYTTILRPLAVTLAIGAWVLFHARSPQSVGTVLWAKPLLATLRPVMRGALSSRGAASLSVATPIEPELAVKDASAADDPAAEPSGADAPDRSAAEPSGADAPDRSAAEPSGADAPDRSRTRKIVAALVLFGVVLGVLGVVLLEVGLGVATDIEPHGYVLVDEETCYYGWGPDTYDGAANRDGTLENKMWTDGEGFRVAQGQSRESAECRVLVVGDSFSHGMYVKAEEAYPAVLGQLLRAAGYDIEVDNGGMPGNTIAEERVSVLGRWASLHPKVVVVGMTSNDLDDLVLLRRRECRLGGAMPAELKPSLPRGASETRIARLGQDLAARIQTLSPRMNAVRDRSGTLTPPPAPDECAAVESTFIELSTDVARGVLAAGGHPVFFAHSELVCGQMPQGADRGPFMTTLRSAIEQTGALYVDGVKVMHAPENTLQPLDGHPSPKGHRAYAEKLAAALDAQSWMSECK